MMVERNGFVIVDIMNFLEIEFDFFSSMIIIGMFYFNFWCVVYIGVGEMIE